MTNVLILVKSLLGPPYPYLKDRGMRWPIPQNLDEELVFFRKRPFYLEKK
jgi:hypothetical protein